MKMSGFFSSLSRSLSEEVKAYTNSHPIRGRILGANSIDAPNSANSDPMSDEPKLEPVRVHPVDRSQSLPAHLVPSGSISDASESGSPTGSPTAACLDSPTATTAAAQQQQQQQQQRKRQYKVHGMDPYDYWSLIKSL